MAAAKVVANSPVEEEEAEEDIAKEAADPMGHQSTREEAVPARRRPEWLVHWVVRRRGQLAFFAGDKETRRGVPAVRDRSWKFVLYPGEPGLVDYAQAELAQSGGGALPSPQHRFVEIRHAGADLAG